MSAPRILVVEDDAALRRGLVAALRQTWGHADAAEGGDEARDCLRDPDRPSYDVVVSDLRLPGCDGLAVLEAALARDPHTRVLLLTAYGTVDGAVAAMRAGAFDFLEKPLDLDQLELRVGRALEHRRLIEEVRALRAEKAGQGAGEIVAESEPMRGAVQLARRVAPSRSSVLITGETGTGKELIAALIHASSDRAGGPLVKVNCAALPETLLESELFGHERGAFTGADRRRAGRFEEAHGGTLFLDEIGELSPGIQAKLLRVLQDQEFHRVGATRPQRTDARVLTATNVDLEAEVRRGAFREDLFFRLDVIRIHLPPLRERPGDLLPLARRFQREFRCGRVDAPQGLEADAVHKLRGHSWPGNVRELRNAIERAQLLAPGPRLRAADLQLGAPRGGSAAAPFCPELPPPGWTLRDWERALLEEALRRTDYVQKEACQLLGISRRKLNYMVRSMGITHPSWRRNRPPLGEPDPGT